MADVGEVGAGDSMPGAICNPRLIGSAYRQNA
jgi:hypothetical protein